MQTKSTSYGKKLLALMLSLLMLVSVLPVSAWAAADAKPEKITLVGSSDALEYEFVDYCYRLGYLPKYNQKQQNTARLHYLLKDDLMKLDELTQQVTLLGKHQIGTDEQLFSYKRSVEAEIKTLTADRTHLRNEIRKVDISDERLSAAKTKISAICPLRGTISPTIRSLSPPGPRRSSSTAPSIWIRPADPAAATRRRTV